MTCLLHVILFICKSIRCNSYVVLPVVSSWVDLPWKIAIGLDDTAKHSPEITGGTVGGWKSVAFHMCFFFS